MSQVCGAVIVCYELVEMYDCVCCGGFSIYVYVKVGIIMVYSDVQKIDAVVTFQCVVKY